MATENGPFPIFGDIAAVQATAKLLSDVADAYNKRLKLEAPKLDGAEVYARLQEEQRLRSISNQLYFEAAQRVLDDAVDDQKQLEGDLAKAKERLKKIEDWAQALDLIADLLVLAGALLARKPGPIVAALKEVRDDIKTAKA
ncbi:hypothetical protein [Acidovorax sp. SUPP2539]|uniref:hypothetical protein n=1 Tax=Acidovorax sp. SUPP2539 TaxID=2920878 RepID=UPI0023DE6199|nr:hypothetical protein [Acidovorax sp. SUPP2539]GKS90138.1 hypothetical protein AVTE2539_12255 [Acidovorax sp. SUPP2539]